MPMLGGKQIIIVREAQALRKVEELAVYLKSPSPYSVLVICYKGKTIDGRTAFAKQLSQVGVVFTSARPRDYEIGSWLKSYIEGKGLRIEQKALEMLTDHLGTDIAKISNELTKLLTYLPEGTKQITANHIEDNIGISKDFNIFELTKAISERNLAKAMLIADHFRRNPSDNPLVVTTAQLFTHFQRIFILNYHRWAQQKRGVPMPSETQLSAEMKLPHPYFLNEYKAAATLYPNRKVFAIFGALRECDTRSKGIAGGSMNDGELLRDLLLKIFI
jgi:DNA polymerase-3 subunit delta